MKGRGGIDEGGGLFIAGHVCHTRGHALHAVSDRGAGVSDITNASLC